MKATLINDSPARSSIAIWVRMAKAPDDMPVAWICAALSRQSFTVFEWETVYEFVWANTGKLISGKTIRAAERIEAAVPTVRLERAGDSYRFIPIASAARSARRLTITTMDDIPQGVLAIGMNIRITSGIGQPGDAANVVQAHPNMVRAWETGEHYYANFGAIAQSEYDPEILRKQPPLDLDFSAGPEIGVLLDSSNTLKQLTDSQVDALIAGREFKRVVSMI
jgi:hypothetical protein